MNASVETIQAQNELIQVFDIPFTLNEDQELYIADSPIDDVIFDLWTHANVAQLIAPVFGSLMYVDRNKMRRKGLLSTESGLSKDEILYAKNKIEEGADLYFKFSKPHLEIAEIYREFVSRELRPNEWELIV